MFAANTKRYSLACVLALSALSTAKGIAAELDDDPLPAGALARLGTRRFRHESETYSLAFSPDKKILAAGAGDGNVYLWETTTGKLLHRLAVGPFNRSYPGIAFAPDGKRLAVVLAGSSELALWQVATGKRLWKQAITIRYRSPASLPVLYSPDGKRLYVPVGTGRSNVSVAVIDAANGQEIRQIGETNDFIDSLALSPDGKTLALGLRKEKLTRQAIRLLDVAANKVLRELPSQGPANWLLFSLAFSVDGRTIAWTVPEHIFLADCATGKQIAVLDTPGESSIQLLFTPDGKSLFTDGPDSKVYLWDVARRKVRREFDGRMWGGRCVAMSGDGQLVAVGSVCSSIRLWEVATGRELGRRFAGHDAEVVTLAFSPDGKRLLSGDNNNQVRLWDTFAARSLRQWRTDSGVLAFSHDGKRFLSANGRGTRFTGEKLDDAVHVWDTASGKELLQLHHKDGYFVRQAVFSLDDREVITVDSVADRWHAPQSADAARQHVWDGGTGRRIRTRSLGRDYPSFLLLAADGETLAWGGQAFGTGIPLRFWSVAEGRSTGALPATKGWIPLGLSVDGRYLAVRHWADAPFGNYYWDDKAYLFETATGKEVLRHAMPAGVLAISVDSRFAAIAPDGWMQSHPSVKQISPSFCLYDLAAEKVVWRVPVEDAHIHSLAFSPDGRRLAAGLGDGTILLWDLTRTLRAAEQRNADELAPLWADLACGDARQAATAMWNLTGRGGKAVAYIGKHIAPAVVPDAPRLRRLVADLDSAEFTVRERAAADLEKMTDAAEPALRHALRQKPTLEARRRIEGLLAKLESRPLAAERLRAVRAITVLERIGNAEARQLLAKLAAGQPDVRLSKDAKAALQRLKAP